MELLLIRHGLSEANVDPSIYDTKKDHEILLHEKGYAQATALGKELNKLLEYRRVDFFVSPYKRAVDTYEAIKKEATNYDDFKVVTPLLREQEHPNDATPEQMIQYKKDRSAFDLFYYRYPNAESQADVHLRVQTFINDLEIRRMKHELSTTVVLVAHEVVIRMVLMILDGLPPEKANMTIPNCEVIKRYL